MMEPLVGTKASQEQLKTIYSIVMHIKEFCKVLQAFDMDDVFVITNKYIQDEQDPGKNMIPADGRG